MTDQEFDVLDALYFVVPFQEVVEESGLTVAVVKDVLAQLFEKGWIRCYHSPGEEIAEHEADLSSHGMSYYYLATKAGLLAHNGR